MKCLECESLDLRTYPKHAAVGFGQCKKQTLPGVFVSITYGKDCTKFSPAPEDVKQKRIEWWNGRGK